MFAANLVKVTRRVTESAVFKGQVVCQRVRKGWIFQRCLARAAMGVTAWEWLAPAGLQELATAGGRLPEAVVQWSDWETQQNLHSCRYMASEDAVISSRGGLYPRFNVVHLQWKNVPPASPQQPVGMDASSKLKLWRSWSAILLLVHGEKGKKKSLPEPLWHLKVSATVFGLQAVQGLWAGWWGCEDAQGRRHQPG